MAGICNVHPWPKDESKNGCNQCRIEVCDVCRATPAWVYLAEPFVSTIKATKKDGKVETFTQYNSAEWAICEDCHVLIQADNIEGLTERALGATWDADPKPQRTDELRAILKADMMRFHGEFVKGIQRPPTKILPA